MKTLFFFFLTVCVVGTVQAQVKGVKVEDERRRYLVYLPKAYHENPEQSFPLVFNFHGGGMTAAEQMFYTGMNNTADKYGFIVVYPTGINQDWNVGFDMSYQHGHKDVEFVQAMLTSLKKEYSIDEKAIFACGLSRGGFFTHRLASELPDTFAAIASISGPLPDSVQFFHKQANPISVMQVHGTEDRVVNFDGKPNAYASAQDTFHFWLKNNGLNPTGAISQVFDKHQEDSTSLEWIQVKGKVVSVHLLSITGGGHTWPGADPFNIGFPLGKTSKELDMNEVLWDFFSKNKKP
ncbi:PHB depolymerase family esterase [Algoriphagus sp. AK58]|uniref:extracellular catalytic domain type 1 short-chain-length polyhydroxyalkanoate depolymerase n=1 Tax=Algoriphagus sp. AK58 TaxID=1406877 RepID=UPI00164FBE12|nr:PHB depolymerase family esterase [Algoriphagus sp. AK58]MBC6365837.1 hypothetical protein [Algoriphagus sp. AK58]